MRLRKGKAAPDTWELAWYHPDRSRCALWLEGFDLQVEMFRTERSRSGGRAMLEM